MLLYANFNISILFKKPKTSQNNKSLCTASTTTSNNKKKIAHNFLQ